MRTVVAIHNSVNERAWQEVMAWEHLHCRQCAEAKLKKFQGKPDQLSPKARMINLMVRGEGGAVEGRGGGEVGGLVLMDKYWWLVVVGFLVLPVSYSHATAVPHCWWW